MNRALENMGFNKTQKNSNRLHSKENFKDWRNREVAELERLMGERRIERKQVGTHSYLNHREYKEMKREIDTQKDKAQEFMRIRDELEVRLNKKTKEVNKKEKKSTELSSENMELKNKNDTLTQRLNQLNWYVEEQEGKKNSFQRHGPADSAGLGFKGRNESLKVVG